MSRILVTGATGFTGSYLARKLADSGHEVHGTSFGQGEAQADGASKLHPVDLGDFESIAAVVDEVAPDRVVHLAAIAFVGHSDINAMYRANVVGTRNLLEALARTARRPQSVLLASSANIYGNTRSGMIDEDAPVAPVNDYGITKAASEIVAGAYSSRLPLIVVRPFNYTGRGQSEQFLIPKIVAHIRRREAEIELGNLDVARDFSDVRAVVDAYERLIGTPEAIGGTFNVCSGKATSISDLLEMVRAISGRDLSVRINPQFARSNEVKSLCGSRERLERAIGPLDMPPLESTLRWMLEG